jgi:CDP-4-dehydro-6-deoxyglucose reductase, E1
MIGFVSTKKEVRVTELPLASSTWNDEELAAMHSVISSGNFTMGRLVKEFEEAFAEFFGSKFAVMVNSGSSANLLMLAAERYVVDSKMSEGSEVIVPAVSWSTTYFPVHQLGYKLRFVDIDPLTLNINVDLVEKAINANTSAILAVNLLGNPCDLLRLRKLAEKYDLVLLEDNCESMGATVGEKFAGTVGHAGTFSTFFSHHICTMEGGVVVTDDENLFHTMKSLRAHGWTRDLPPVNSVHNKSGLEWDDLFRFVLPGYNLRPLEIEAAIGLVQLKKISNFLEKRRENAAYFLERVRNIPGVRVQTEFENSSWFGFSIVLEKHLEGHRTKLVSTLENLGISTRPIVAGNFTKNPVMKHLNHAELEKFPAADAVHDNGFFVGNHHYDVIRQLDSLAGVLHSYSEENS